MIILEHFFRSGGQGELKDCLHVLFNEKLPKQQNMTSQRIKVNQPVTMKLCIDNIDKCWL